MIAGVGGGIGVCVVELIDPLRTRPERTEAVAVQQTEQRLFEIKILLSLTAGRKNQEEIEVQVSLSGY